MSETETHRNKVALTAALVVALIALAGVGYAASHTYTGTTQSTAHNVDVDFISVELDADSYTTTHATNIHAIWNSTTAGDSSTGTASTTYTFKEADKAKYEITVKAGAVENGETISLTVTGITADLGNYTVSYGFSTAEDTEPVSYSEASSITYSNINAGTDNNVFYLWIKLTGKTLTAGTAPTTTVEIPALTFTATVEYTE